MPTAVKIRDGLYGNAIGLLLETGGVFQTRHERILLVDSQQRRILEEANLVECNGALEEPGERNGQEKTAG